MDRLLKRFHREAQALPNRRYPKELRELACQYAHQRIAQGDAISYVANQLGVARQTLYSWLWQPGSDFVQVELTESMQPEQSEREKIVLVSPNGYRVEGLDLRSVSVLLRELR